MLLGLLAGPGVAGRTAGGAIAWAAATATGRAGLFIGATGAFDEDAVDGVGVDDLGACGGGFGDAIDGEFGADGECEEFGFGWGDVDELAAVELSTVDDAAGIEVEGFDGAFDMDGFAVIGIGCGIGFTFGVGEGEEADDGVVGFDGFGAAGTALGAAVHGLHAGAAWATWTAGAATATGAALCLRDRLGGVGRVGRCRG